MPGLLRGMARVAVVSGTATAVSNRTSRRQSQRWAAQDQQAYQQEAAPPPAAAPASAPAAGESRIDQLKELGALKEQGVLNDAEFEAEKARILG
jgi:phage-related tail fiber protein